MNESGKSARSHAARHDAAALLPAVDVCEDAGGITLRADLPGVPRERLEIRVEAGSLTIEGEIALAGPDDVAPSHVEVGLPRYRRVFTLSRELDTGRVSAEFRHGVLTLRIPKAAHARPRRIPIESNRAMHGGRP